MADIKERKAEHVAVCLDEAVESGAVHGFDRWRLNYTALPEIALEDVDLSVEIASKTLSAPLVIGAMTGGTTEVGQINRILAKAAESRQIGFALGSGRVALEHEESLASFQVRDVAPTTLLFANLGAVQFNYGITGQDAQTLCERLEADALNLHLNPLQEAIQPNGDTNFRGLAAKMETALKDIQVPVFVKEVGAGIAPETAARLAQMPIAGIETAGVGGTSWARVEAFRTAERDSKYTGFTLGGVGISTVESIIACRDALPDRVVIGSGGIRTALDVAKAIALGADAVAAALPFLKAAQQGEEAVVQLIDQWTHALRVACFVCGARTPAELRGRIRKWKN